MSRNRFRILLNSAGTLWMSLFAPLGAARQGGRPCTLALTLIVGMTAACGNAAAQDWSASPIDYELVDPNTATFQPVNPYSPGPPGYGDIDFSQAPFLYETEIGSFFPDNCDPIYLTLSGGYSQAVAGPLKHIAKEAAEFNVRLSQTQYKGHLFGSPLHFGFALSYQHSEWRTKGTTDLLLSPTFDRFFHVDDLRYDMFGFGPQWRLFLPTFANGDRVLFDYRFEGIGGTGTAGVSELAAQDASHFQYLTESGSPGHRQGVFGFRTGLMAGYVRPSGLSLSAGVEYSFFRSPLLTGNYQNSEFVSAMGSLGIPTDVLFQSVADLFDR